ncbi:NRT2.1, partial [Symbiodinium pilosum]
LGYANRQALRSSNHREDAKAQHVGFLDEIRGLKEVSVWFVLSTLGKLTHLNNQLATHFRTYFQMAAGDASALAGAFGYVLVRLHARIDQARNLFARSLGGITSDLMYKNFAFRGRIWAQFLVLFFEAVFLFAFGNVDNSQPWYVALAVLVCFSLFVQMDALTPFKVHAGYVMFWALLSPCYYWSEYGGMFMGPAATSEKSKGQISDSEMSTEAPSERC